MTGCGETEQGTAIFYSFTAYSNGKHGVELSLVSGVRLKGFKVADNVENGIEIQDVRFSWGWSSVEVRVCVRVCTWVHAFCVRQSDRMREESLTKL